MDKRQEAVMASQPDNQPSDNGSGYRAQLADARAALELMAQPGFLRIEEHYKRIASHYESMLFNTNLDKDIRQNICFAVEVARKFLGVRSHFEQMQKAAESELKKLEVPTMSQAEVGSRITSFMR